MLRSIYILFATLIFAFGLAPDQARAKSMALVIGNDSYVNVSSLQKARSDASGYHQLLSQLGFEVSLQTDLNASDMTFHLATFFDRIEPGDTVVFVFSGHGWSDGRENFLVPTDIRISGSETLLSRESFALRNGANGVLDEIAKRGAGLTLAIIDACRDNPLAAQNGTRSVGIARGLAPLKAPTGTFVAFSAGAGQTALDRLSNTDAEPYSVFTRHFLRELSKPQDLQSAFKRTQRLVNNEAGSIGHPQRPAYYDEVIGSACLSGNCGQGAVSTPQPTLAKPQNTDSHAEAAQAWEAFKTSKSLQALEMFSLRYAGTAYAALAQERIAALSAPAPQPSQPAVPLVAPQPTAPQRTYVARPNWCPRAATAAEIAICSDDTLSQYDQQMNAAYGYWTNVLSGSAQTQFIAQQKQWLRSRNACGSNSACLANAYWTRLMAMQN